MLTWVHISPLSYLILIIHTCYKKQTINARMCLNTHACNIGVYNINGTITSRPVSMLNKCTCWSGCLLKHTSTRVVWCRQLGKKQTLSITQLDLETVKTLQIKFLIGELPVQIISNLAISLFKLVHWRSSSEFLNVLLNHALHWLVIVSSLKRIQNPCIRQFDN